MTARPLGGPLASEARDAGWRLVGGPRRGARRGGGQPGERGSGSLLAVIWIAVLLAVAGVAMAVGGSLILRARAAAAADLAALAGAGAALDGEAASCRLAGKIAAANGAALASCRLDATQAWVEVRLPVPAPVAALLPGSPPSVGARAHAALVPSREE